MLINGVKLYYFFFLFFYVFLLFDILISPLISPKPYLLFWIRNPVVRWLCVFIKKVFFFEKNRESRRPDWIFIYFRFPVLSRTHCLLIRESGKYLLFHHCVSLISFDIIIIIIIIEYTWILNFLLNRNEIRAKYKIFGRRRDGNEIVEINRQRVDLFKDTM